TPRRRAEHGPGQPAQPRHPRPLPPPPRRRGGARLHRPRLRRPPPARGGEVRPRRPRRSMMMNTTAVPVRSGDDTANAAPLTDAEQRVLARFVDLGLAHPVAVLTRL